MNSLSNLVHGIMNTLSFEEINLIMNSSLLPAFLWICQVDLRPPVRHLTEGVQVKVSDFLYLDIFLGLDYGGSGTFDRIKKN